MDYILELEDVSKQFGTDGFQLDHISFSLPYGSILGLIGENGAGKTTAIGCILNTLFRDSGTIKILGHVMTDKDTAVREDIGVVFDAGNFSEDLTAGQLSEVMQGIYSHWDHALYLSYLEKFRLPRNKKRKTFSKGMSMKLSIAAALSHRPKLLILDEATGGLDPIIRDEILEVFLDFVQDENHSILLSSHITGDLEKIADYITFIHEGKMILSEKKDDLLYNYTIARCKTSQFAEMDKKDIIAYRKRDLQIDVLMKARKEMERKYRNVVMDMVSIDDIMLLLVKGERV